LEGHDVVGVASGGQEALAMCADLAPDVLVVDHRMPPGPWGLEVARIVAGRHPAIRVVLYTNYEDPELIAGAREAGATYLPKGNLAALRRAVSGPDRSAGGSGQGASRPRSS
jgi:DNA-binding NarL/FixJ family response regulator